MRKFLNYQQIYNHLLFSNTPYIVLENIFLQFVLNQNPNKVIVVSLNSL